MSDRAMAEVCIPEWCAQEGDAHDETCPKHPYELTKGGFVDAAEISAANAVTAYLVMAGDGFTHEESLAAAVAEANEAATCWVGIGSCGRGWCNH